MGGLEIWKTFILPVIQYLIGPIVTGFAIWYLTNKRSLNENKDKMVRQKNENQVALQKLINQIEDMKESINYRQELTNDLDKMYEGDFSMVEVEEGERIFEQECIEQYESWKRDASMTIGKKSLLVENAFKKFKDTPIDLLPQKIHFEIVGIHSEDKIDIYSEEYTRVLNNLKNIK